jgi:hypothetical protein
MARCDAGLIYCHIYPLIGNDRETNNEKTAIARKQIRKYATVLELLLGSGSPEILEVLLEAMFSMYRSEAISLYRRVDDQCVRGVEYLHRDPASRRRRRKWKSQN